MQKLLSTMLLTTPLALVALAADPLTGTWKLDPAKTKESNPTQVTYTASGDGVSIQTDTDKPISAKYDGEEYPTAAGTTVSIKRLNDHALVITTKRNGKLVNTSTRTVSSDGKHLTTVTEGTGVSGAFKNTSFLERIGSAPGGDAFLGKWREDRSKAKFEPPRTYTIKADGDTLDFTTNNNHILTAKFDGNEYKQDNSNTMVRLKRANDHTIQFSLNRPNGPAETSTWEVNGNTLVETFSGAGADGKPFKEVTYFERQH